MSNIKVYGEHEPKTLAQMQRCVTVGSAVKGVLCADGHLGYAHPIGGVVAYEEDISISGVGFDIACGNMAVRLDAHYSDISPRAKTVLDDIGRAFSFGVGQRNAVKGRSRAVQLSAPGCGQRRQPQGDGAQSARHRRVRQPLCRSL
jgi:tRNA-splicing ligase RtcB